MPDLELKNLEIADPLKDTIEHKTEFVNVSKYRKLKITSFSDTIVQVNLDFSNDGINTGCNNMFRIASDRWATEEFLVQMDYLRIRVVNQSGKQNEKISIAVTPVKYNEVFLHEAERKSQRLSAIETSRSFSNDLNLSSDVPPEPSFSAPAPPAKEEEEKKKKKRFQSPFSKSRRERDSKSKSTVLDYRIPQSIPEGALLYGGKLGELKILPKGQPGDALVIGPEGELMWKKLFTPSESSDKPSRIPPPLCPPGSNVPSSPSISFRLSKIDDAE